jgi:hypothetical protein
MDLKTGKDIGGLTASPAQRRKSSARRSRRWWSRSPARHAWSDRGRRRGRFERRGRIGGDQSGHPHSRYSTIPVLTRSRDRRCGRGSAAPIVRGTTAALSGSTSERVPLRVSHRGSRRLCGDLGGGPDGPSGAVGPGAAEWDMLELSASSTTPRLDLDRRPISRLPLADHDGVI